MDLAELTAALGPESNAAAAEPTPEQIARADAQRKRLRPRTATLGDVYDHSEEILSAESPT